MQSGSLLRSTKNIDWGIRRNLSVTILPWGFRQFSIAHSYMESTHIFEEENHQHLVGPRRHWEGKITTRAKCWRLECLSEFVRQTLELEFLPVVYYQGRSMLNTTLNQEEQYIAYRH